MNIIETLQHEKDFSPIESFRGFGHAAFVRTINT